VFVGRGYYPWLYCLKLRKFYYKSSGNYVYFFHGWSAIPGQLLFNRRIMLRLLALSLLTCSTLLAVSVSAPEIDPSTGYSAIALLAGSVLVIRGRLKK